MHDVASEDLSVVRPRQVGGKTAARRLKAKKQSHRVAAR